MIDVTFLVPCCNNASTVRQTLESLLAMRTGATFDVLVVDDGSTDASRDIVDKMMVRASGKIRAIVKKRGGESSALNAGWRVCSSRYVAIVEADVEVDPDWLDMTMAEFRDERVQGVGGVLCTPLTDAWIARLAGYEIEYKMMTMPKETRHISSANAIYRTKIFGEVGPFDESLLNASLDADFNARILAKGYRLVFCRDAFVLHHYKSSIVGYLTRQYAYGRYRVYLAGLDLYPRDKMLALNVALSLLLLPVLLFVPLAPRLVTAYLVLLLLLHLPMTLVLWQRKRDPVLLLMPAILVLRNVVGGIGYMVGFIEKNAWKPLLRTKGE